MAGVADIPGLHSRGFFWPTIKVATSLSLQNGERLQQPESGAMVDGSSAGMITIQDEQTGAVWLHPKKMHGNEQSTKRHACARDL